ncbi:MAG TPA: amidohydrolase family protein [Actinomycetota bacterium]|nr:amidohydrolase family protein [Actinomycetota bacterium]
MDVIADPAQADLLFVNGTIHAPEVTGRSRPEAVAVKDGRIAAVGADADLREGAGPRTEIVDLGGRMLIPGFQDAHVHPPASGLEMLRCNLSDVYTLDEYERIIAAYADAHPDRGWIDGGGWSMDLFPGGNPGRDFLDRVVPDRPVFLWSRDGHSGWVNSKALEVAGMSRDTPDPADGWIVRAANGEPAGALHEGAASLVERHVPKMSSRDWIEGLRIAQRHLHSLGITAWQDANVGTDAGYPTFDPYLEAATSGELTARVIGALWWDRHRGLDQIDDLLALRERGVVGRFAATSVKIMQDGVIENFTAGVLEPYLDAEGRPTDNVGKSFVDPEELKGAVTRLDAEGFQVHVHAIGERAVREALDAFEAARGANGPNDLRHHIAHIQVIHPDDVPRFASLGVVANAQPLWAVNEGQMEHLTKPFLGPERTTWQYPFGSLARAGAVVAMGSDWSVSSPDPVWGIHVAVNRTSPPAFPYGHASEEPFLPDERLDVPTALDGYTINSAYVNHLDATTGSIEVGKDADLVVLDRDLLSLPAGEVYSARVQLTMVAGERVFATGDLA